MPFHAHMPRRFAGLLPRGLWPRLALLMLTATAPMLLLLLLSALGDGRRVVEAAREQVVQLARLAAEQQDDTLQEATNLLRVLGKVGAVRDIRPGPCDDLLREVASDHPRLDAIAVARADGRVMCGSRPAPTAWTQGTGRTSRKPWHRTAPVRCSAT